MNTILDRTSLLTTITIISFHFQKQNVTKEECTIQTVPLYYQHLFYRNMVKTKI